MSNVRGFKVHLGSLSFQIQSQSEKKKKYLTIISTGKKEKKKVGDVE